MRISDWSSDVCSSDLRMRADSQEMLRRNLDTQSAADGIDRLIDDYLSDRMMHRIEASCPLPMLGQEARRLPPAARSVLSDTIDNFRRRLVETLTELGRPSPSPLADSVTAELPGADRQSTRLNSSH